MNKSTMHLVNPIIFDDAWDIYGLHMTAVHQWFPLNLVEGKIWVRYDFRQQQITKHMVSWKRYFDILSVLYAYTRIYIEARRKKLYLPDNGNPVFSDNVTLIETYPVYRSDFVTLGVAARM